MFGIPWAPYKEGGGGGSHRIPALWILTQEGRQSLEELLKQAEVARARSLEALQPEVARLAGELDGLKIPTRSSRTVARQREPLRTRLPRGVVTSGQTAYAKTCMLPKHVEIQSHPIHRHQAEP